MENIELYLIENFPHIPVNNVQVMIEAAKEDILNYCNLSEVPTGLNNTLLQMVIHKINTMNEIGVNNINGVVTMTYDHSYPQGVYKSLRRYRKLA